MTDQPTNQNTHSFICSLVCSFLCFIHSFTCSPCTYLCVSGRDQERSPPSEVFIQGVKDCLCGTNRQKLLYAQRAMERIDPNDMGIIYSREFKDILLMYQIYILGGTLEKLIDHFKMHGGKVRYKHLWSFVLGKG